MAKERDERYTHRVIVLAIVGLSTGLGAVTILSSDEMTKVLENSALRTALILFAPLAALALTGYSLALRSRRSYHVAKEALALAGAYLLCLSVVLPTVATQFFYPDPDCSFWIFQCQPQGDLMRWSLSLLLLFAGGGLLGIAITRPTR